MKSQQYIQIEPQLIDLPFPEDLICSSGAIKIKNLTSLPIYDLQFSIFNPQKFSFYPEVFHLQGYEEKIIQVEVKPQSLKSPFKQFAYIKSPSPLINKRITLVVGKNHQNHSFMSHGNNKELQDQEPSQGLEFERRRVTQEENMDPHSLSNRAYNIAQAKAHEKMLMEKDSLIDKMEMEIQTKIAQCLKFQEEIRGKDREIEGEKRRSNEYRLEVEEWKYQVQELKVKFVGAEKSAVKAKDEERLLRIEEERLRMENERITILLRREMEEQKRIYQLELNRYEVRLSELEAAMKEESVHSVERFKFQQELRVREDELRRARVELDTARRYEIDASRLDEQKQSLVLQVNGYLNEIQYYKEQMIRSRLQVEKKLGAEKERNTITLQELKIENEVLIKKKIQLQNALETANKQLEILKSRYNSQVNTPIRVSYNKQNEEELANLREENASLQAKVNEGCLECQGNRVKLEEMRVEMEEKVAQLNSEKESIRAEEQENTRELRKQLDNLNETAVNKIKKLKADKKKLQQEIKTSQGEERNKSHSHHEKQQTKLELLENQLAEMREELLMVKTKQKSDDKKTGIRNQSREIEESRSNKSQSMIRDQRVYEELGQLKELEKILKIEQRRLGEQNGIVSRDGIFGVVDMFKVIRDRLNTDREWWRQEESEYLNEIKGLKLRLVEVESNREKENYNNNSSYFSSESSKKLYQYVQQEMRNQYKKLNDTIQLLQQKHQIFKRKMLSEFRGKLLEIIFKKDRKELNKLQQLLEKLIESVYNVSHKEALYSREVKRKLELRKENKELRGKVSQLELVIQEKKGYCSREPVKVVVRRDEDAFETIKLEATLMSCRAENERLKEEIEILKETNSSTSEQYKISVQLLEKKEYQVSKLKEQIVDIDTLHRQQLTNAVNQLDLMKGQFLKISQLEQKVAALSGKQRQNQQLKQELLRKKDIIKGLKEKERTLNEAVENSHRELEHQQHSVEKARSKEEIRLQEMVGEFKEKNKQLKGEVEKKEDQIRQLKEDLDKKNAYLATQKMMSNTSTSRNERERERVEGYANQVEQLKEDNKKLTDKNGDLKTSNTKLHNQIETLKSKLGEIQKQVTKLTNELKNQENEYLIKEKSLQSYIRGIIEMLRRLWRSIEFKVRKVCSGYKFTDTFEEMVKDNTQVDVIKMYNAYEAMLNAIDAD